MKRMRIFYPVIILSILISCNSSRQSYRERIDLSGEWQFKLDTVKNGEERKWYLTNLDETIQLPGTTDSNRKGFLNNDTTSMHLNRVYTYEGAAWYRRKVDIPASFSGKCIQLSLERTKSSMIWIDSSFIGGSRILQSPQVFDVSEFLTPGEHFITIMIDNDLKLTPYGNVHIYSDETQTNWNGIIGSIFLEAAPLTHITDIRVYPDIQNRKFDVRLGIDNQSDLDIINVKLLVETGYKGKTKSHRPLKFNAECREEISFDYNLMESELWDEFQQPLYHLTVIISSGDIKDSRQITFGMRKFGVRGTQFTINGRTTFLRGKHDAAVFPLTGYSPMDAESWQRIFQTAKQYGINHYRFHSWCPPEAAFKAADLEGIYLQAELPFWGGLDSDSVAMMLRQEGFQMLRSYGNHPSFVMFSHGNEIWSGHDRVEENILVFKAYDDRPLYTMGSNNNIGYIAPQECSDFFVGARTPYAYDTILTHTRLTHAFADSRDGGILNSQIPNTEITFSYPVSHMDIPVIGHETGQYQIFPDYREINKYTGVVRAWNLEVFRNRLENAGMGQLDSAFHRASGVWSAECYRAEMEAALRTEGFAGFQLLDLQDFPGQGTALVGILDAFMESKQVITPVVWRQSCNSVVLLLEFPDYCLTTDETFLATVKVANYSDNNINDPLAWTIRDQKGDTVLQAEFPTIDIQCGGLTRIGEISAGLSSLAGPDKLTIDISIPGTEFRNSYPLWIYPPVSPVDKPDEVFISEKLDYNTLSALKAGSKVLLFPQTEAVSANSVPGLFPPDFWNYGMFKMISEWNGKPISPGTLGLLTDPDHPVFDAFPTDFHTNWQWFSIIKASNSLILDNTGTDYLPVVQIIDNIERNHKLGLIFEFRVGAGRLLVCMSQLNTITNRPEAVQLYRSLLQYMESEEFDPAYEITPEELVKMI